MVNLVSKLKQWTEEYLEGSEQFLVDVENKPGSNKYTVLVDGIEAISIKRCGMISRQLSKRMDEDTDIDEDYNFIFEVSSPGADRSLKIVKQYPKHIGRELDIVTTDEKKNNRYVGSRGRGNNCFKHPNFKKRDRPGAHRI